MCFCISNTNKLRVTAQTGNRKLKLEPEAEKAKAEAESLNLKSNKKNVGLKPCKNSSLKLRSLRLKLNGKCFK